MSSAELRNAVARRLGIPPAQLITSGPFPGDTSSGSAPPPSAARGDQVLGEKAPYRLDFAAQTDLPLVRSSPAPRIPHSRRGWRTRRSGPSATPSRHSRTRSRSSRLGASSYASSAPPRPTGEPPRTRQDPRSPRVPRRARHRPAGDRRLLAHRRPAGDRRGGRPLGLCGRHRGRARAGRPPSPSHRRRRVLRPCPGGHDRRRRARNYAAVAVGALFVALLAAYRPTTSPLGVEPRGLEFAVARAQLLVDSPRSPFADLTEDAGGRRAWRCGSPSSPARPR